MGKVRLDFKDSVECPDSLPDYQSYLLEYFPGSFGDFVSGLISYSIEEFYDTQWSLQMRQRYWNRYDKILSPDAEKPDLILKYEYLLSLKGDGWEHVEKYNDYMLSNFCHHKNRAVFHNKEATKILFNCHPRTSKSGSSIKDFRSQHNDFETTKTFLIHPGKTFEHLLLNSLNFYCTSPAFVWDKENDNYNNFISVWKFMVNSRKIVDDFNFENIIDIRNVADISPDIIKPFGKVRANKFKEMVDAFKEIKFYKLEKRVEEIRAKLIESKEYSLVKGIWSRGNE